MGLMRPGCVLTNDFRPNQIGYIGRMECDAQPLLLEAFAWVNVIVADHLLQ